MDLRLELTKLVVSKSNTNPDQKDLEKTFNIIWQNPRKKLDGGYRLTDEGFRILTEDLELKKYDIVFPKELTLTNQTIIWLDRFIDGPYHLNKKGISVFKEKTAVQLVLFSGNVEKFGLAKAMSNAK